MINTLAYFGKASKGCGTFDPDINLSVEKISLLFLSALHANAYAD
jgi:hypothetical protein